jgi:hypothetical protein
MSTVDFQADAMRVTSPSRVTSAAMLLRVVLAWLALLVAAVLLRTVGIGRVQALLRRLASASDHATDATVQRAMALCQAVDVARAWYVRDVRCLQAAMAAVWLLRLHGIPAHLVIGVQRIPFLAHAWAEVAGTAVINGIPQLSALRVISRT